jgi:malonyl CoA-acyl carrier protein transacylase
VKNKILSVVFPGQGSQRLGMAKDFVESFSESRAVFEKASDCLNLDLFNLCFEDEVRLNQTQFMQPAILTAEIAMLKALEKALGYSPEYFAGHSMGEYTALVAAGVFSFEDGLKLVNGRNALMQNCMPEGSGAMAALILPGLIDSGFEKVLEGTGVELANLNSPNQIVIAGLKDALSSVCAKLVETITGLRYVDLGIGIAFHTSFMSNVEPELREYVDSFEPRMKLDRAKYVLSNLTGKFHTDSQLTSSLVQQISGCVQWIQNMSELANTGCTIIEIGPNKVLGRFFRDSGYSVESVFSLRSLDKVLRHVEAAEGL